MMESSHNRASIGRNSKIRINLCTENCAVESRGHLTLQGNYQKRNEFELAIVQREKCNFLPSLTEATIQDENETSIQHIPHLQSLESCNVDEKTQNQSSMHDKNLPPISVFVQLSSALPCS